MYTYCSKDKKLTNHERQGMSTTGKILWKCKECGNVHSKSNFKPRDPDHYTLPSEFNNRIDAEKIKSNADESPKLVVAPSAEEIS